MILGKEIQELAEWSQDSRNLVGQITIFCSFYPMSSSSTVLPSFEASRSIPMAGPSRRTSSSAVHTWSTKTHQSGMYNNRPSWGCTKQEDSLKQDKIVTWQVTGELRGKPYSLGLWHSGSVSSFWDTLGLDYQEPWFPVSNQNQTSQKQRNAHSVWLRRRQNVRDQGDPEPSESFQSECHKKCWGPVGLSQNLQNTPIVAISSDTVGGVIGWSRQRCRLTQAAVKLQDHHSTTSQLREKLSKRAKDAGDEIKPHKNLDFSATKILFGVCCKVKSVLIGLLWPPNIHYNTKHCNKPNT